MVFLILAAVLLVGLLAAGIAFIERRIAARRKITIFFNNDLVRPREYTIGVDGIPVFNFAIRRESDVILLVRGDGTSETLTADKIRTSGSNQRRPGPRTIFTPSATGYVTREDMDRQFEELRGAFDDTPILPFVPLPPMPAMPPMPDVLARMPLVRPGVVMRDIQVRQVRTAPEPAQTPAAPRFDRDLDIPE